MDISKCNVKGEACASGNPDASKCLEDMVTLRSLDRNPTDDVIGWLGAAGVTNGKVESANACALGNSLVQNLSSSFAQCWLQCDFASKC